MEKPSIEDWKPLYDSAMKFKEAVFWNWMWDSDIFGVQNPDNGEIGYCCIMGRNGDHFALAVYLGSEGLDSFIAMQESEEGCFPFELFCMQKCLSISFEGRASLEKADLEIINKLGLKPKGRNAWPLFRSYIPRKVPWFLDKKEAAFLLIALEQAMDVCARFKENPKLLKPPKKGQYLTRVLSDSVWKDAWTEPAKPPKMPPREEPLDSKMLDSIARNAEKRRGIWEVDEFPMPAAINGEPRPYYPIVTMWTHHMNGMILNMQMEGQGNKGFQEQLLDMSKNLRHLPAKILVGRRSVQARVSPITSVLGIEVELRKNLPAMEMARDGIGDFCAR